MRRSYISEIHLNNFQKYILKKEHDKHNILNHSIRSHDLSNFTTKYSPLSTRKINKNQTIFTNEEKKGLSESSLINKKINKLILTPIQKLKQKFLEPKKKMESYSTYDYIKPLKKNFKLNNLVNSVLFRFYVDESYKKMLSHRVGQKTNKKEILDIKIDLRKTQKKGYFYIPIKKNNLLKEKREIGIQSSDLLEKILNNNDNINSSNSREDKINYDLKAVNKAKIKVHNNNNIINNKNKFRSDKKKKNIPKVNDYKLKFNKYNLINKKLVKNFLNYSERKSIDKFSKIKRVISTERERVAKILDNLRFDQTHDSDKLKIELAKLAVYVSGKGKKKINNNYNIFI